jgi:putative hydrolase of the HAD superfamily
MAVLRAVVFDYGMVLTAQPDQQAHAALLRLTGLPAEQFEPLYWADRHGYDTGDLTGLAFWQKLNKDAGLNLSSDVIDELNRQDARMWTTENPAMLAWQQQLKAHGLRTAILSNMGDSVYESVERTFAWIHRFDVLIWSYQERMAKPNPAIYHLLLDRLGCKPEEVLFLDDKLVNIEAARSLGMNALLFSTVKQLKADLISNGYATQLPLPA